MIRIAVCDDDSEELKTISSCVSKYVKELDIPFKISTFSEGQDLIENINSSKESFDIIFLDIYMKFSNGIDIAKNIREFDEECKIIFITSSREHAVDSYDVRALYYILKPINEDKLGEAINIAIESVLIRNSEIVTLQ
jgi:two-component SAPR family response regulator